jgi:hypothetical protein
MKINWLNVLERAAWTFAEGFLIALPATFTIGMDGAAWKSALLGAGMAGLSALKSLAIDIVKYYKNKGTDE